MKIIYALIALLLVMVYGVASGVAVEHLGGRDDFPQFLFGYIAAMAAMRINSARGTAQVCTIISVCTMAAFGVSLLVAWAAPNWAYWSLQVVPVLALPLGEYLLKNTEAPANEPSN